MWYGGYGLRILNGGLCCVELSCIHDAGVEAMSYVEAAEAER